MKPVAHGPSSTCCLSHSAAAGRSTLSFTVCSPSSGSSSSASVSQHSGRSQITAVSFLSDPLNWMEINVGLLHCVRPTDGYSGPLYVVNALPLASVAELAYKLWVFCYDPSNSQPLRTWWKRRSLTLIGNRPPNRPTECCLSNKMFVRPYFLNSHYFFFFSTRNNKIHFQGRVGYNISKW